MLHRPTRAILALCAALCIASPVVAQTPERFPAIPEAQIQSHLNNAYCAPTITTVARTVGQIPGWRGYAMLLCDPDNEPAGVFVAWMRTGGRRDFIPAKPDGTPFPMPRDSSINDGDQQALFTIFATRLNGEVLGCTFARHNRLQEPFTSSFCRHLDAQGRTIPNR